jgi:hypothetical protein
VVEWLNARVAYSVASALADSTKGQYKGAEEIFLLFCLFMVGSIPFIPVNDELLCQYLQWKSLTVDLKSLKTSLSAVRFLHKRLGNVWVPVRDRQIQGAPMPHGSQKAVLHTCAAKAAYHASLVGEDASV